jgi:hypothetical protein
MESVDDQVQSAKSYEDSLRQLRSGLLQDLLSGDHEIPSSYDQLLESKMS